MRAVLLNSGGIDSPVAGYLMGEHELMAVHFDNQPFSGETTRVAEKVVRRLNEILRREIPQYTIPHGENLSQFLDSCGREERKYTCIFCKRMMLRIAERIAGMHCCDFLLTGENLGQVASQTLHNIYVTSKAVDIPIVRPLIGLDKLEIISIAERIGTYDISVEKVMPCTAVPRYPVVRAHLERMEDLERRLNVERMVEKAGEAVTG